MPSFWDLLCVSRQKYATHDTDTYVSPHHRWLDQVDSDLYIRPQPRLQPDSDPSYPKDSLSWCGSDERSSRHGSTRDFEGRGKGTGSSISGLLDRSGSEGTYDKKRLTQQNRQSSDPGIERRRKKAESDERKKKKQEVAKDGRRRHVQDIFVDNSRYQDDTYRILNESSTSMTSSYDGRSVRRGSEKQGGHRRRNDKRYRNEQDNASYFSKQRDVVRYQHREGNDTGGPQSPRGGMDYPHRQGNGMGYPYRQKDGTDYPFRQGEGSGYYNNKREQGPSYHEPQGRQDSRSSLGAESAKGGDSMYQYTPRSVDDNAISAALFGNRLDDFVHDPGWNRAMDKFAVSPTATDSSFSYSDPNSPKANTASTPGVSSPGWNSSATSRHSGQESKASEWRKSYQRVASQGSDGNLMYVLPEGRKGSELRNVSQSDVVLSSNTSRTTSHLNTTKAYEDRFGSEQFTDDNRNSYHANFNMSDIKGGNHADDGMTNPTNESDIEQFFCSSGDVLY